MTLLVGKEQYVACAIESMNLDQVRRVLGIDMIAAFLIGAYPDHKFPFCLTLNYCHNELIVNHK